MDTLSQQYAILIGASALLWWLLKSPAARGLIAFAGGAAFFAAPLWQKLDQPIEQRALPLAMFLAAGIVTVWGVRTVAGAPAASRARKATIPIVLLTAALVVWKAAAAPWWPKDIAPITRYGVPLGLSYYILRAIAAIVETSRGTLKEATLVETAGFLGFAPILSTGPIERATAFLGQSRKPAPLAAVPGFAAESAGRIIEGLFKTLILGETLSRFARPFISPGTPTAVTAGVAPEELWRALYCYSLYLYVNFSGATDLAVGTARLFGLRIAENFDLPYARPNLSEFWRGWHMSLSTWLRDFLFFPLGRRLPRDAAPIVAPLLVMGLCGLWHGVTVPFLVWGLLHGAGLAIHQLWLRARRANAVVDRAAGNVIGRTIFTVLTAHFVAFTWIFFTAPTLDAAFANVRSMAGYAGYAGKTIGIACAVVAAWSFIPGIRDALRRKAASTPETVGSLMASLWRVHVDVVLALLVLAFLFLSKTRPEGAFVYQGF